MIRKITGIILFLYFVVDVKSQTPQTPGITEEVLGDVMNSIPSSWEAPFLIKDLGIQYDKTILNSTDNIANYNTSYKQALNLGIYSTDLGYANIYEQPRDAIYYLGSVRDMAEGLNIGEFFDFNTIKQLATSSNNLDSLLLITHANLERINEHLQEKKRSDLAILILTGEWLEALYLTCKVTKKHPNELLNNRIGEQKIILDQLILLLSFYESNKNIKKLINDLNGLQKVYDPIKIVYDYERASTEETSTRVSFTAEDLDNILNISARIRQKIIG